MYKCESCRKKIGQKIPMAVIPVQTRKKTYEDSSKVGSEIVKVIKCCPKCAKKKRDNKKTKTKTTPKIKSK